MNDPTPAIPSTAGLEPYPFRESIGFLLSRLKGRMAAVLDEELLRAGMDITHAQWVVLMRVACGLGATCADVARFLGQDSGAMTRMFDRLEEKQLIQRERSADDRRVVSIHLTAQGIALYPQLLAVGRRMHERMNANIPAADIDALRSTLRSMLANLGSPEVTP